MTTAVTSQTDLPDLPLERIADALVLDMLHKFHGRDRERDSRIEAMIANENHGVFVPRRYVKGTMLLGFPGHGKTTAYKVAAKRVADGLGMRLLINPPDTVEVGKNDLLMISQEMSGEVHNTGTTGLPMIRKLAAQNNDAQDSEQNVSLPGIPASSSAEYTAYAPDRRLVQSRAAGQCVVLFDDALNAAPNIQNILLALTEEGRYRGLDLGANTYVGLTGNLGSLDGTHVSRAGAAMRTRLKTFLVQDSLEQWTHRTQMECKTVVGDGGISAFLAQNTELFHAPNPRGYGSYPCPRTWSALVAENEEIALTLHHLRENSRLTPAVLEQYLVRLRDAAIGSVGQAAATKLRAFVHANQTDAIPLARALLKNNGVFDEAQGNLFAQNYGSGSSMGQMEFGHQFALAVAEMCAAQVVNALPKVGEKAPAVTPAAQAAYQLFTSSLMDAVTPRLADNIVARALSHFVVRLTSMDPRLAEVDNKSIRPQFLGAEQKQHLNTLARSALNTKRGKEDVLPGNSFYAMIVVPEISGMNSMQFTGVAKGTDDCRLEEFGDDCDEDSAIDQSAPSP